MEQSFTPRTAAVVGNSKHQVRLRTSLVSVLLMQTMVGQWETVEQSYIPQMAAATGPTKSQVQQRLLTVSILQTLKPVG